MSERVDDRGSIALMKRSRPRIAVVGGAGMGVIFDVPRIPTAGETLIAPSSRLLHGGKSSNQAVGAARLGAEVSFLSAVGSDAFGETMKRMWQSADLDVDAVVEIGGCGTMLGALMIEPDGENRIVLAREALDRLLPEHVDAFEERIANSDVCVVGLEIPVEPALRALELARRHHVPTVLNPAPAPPPAVAARLLELSDFVTPNLGEGIAMVDQRGTPEEIAASLRERGATTVAMTLGERGALLVTAALAKRIPAQPVSMVKDSSGAGDAFTSAFAVALARGADLEAACVGGCRAAALIIQGTGFVEALALWDELELEL